MTAIVCNTGPMIALAGIERLDILRGLYESVYLPQARA
jgi:predicted nucleic acid-binding protein